MRKFHVLALAGAFLALATSAASAQRRLTGRVTATTGQALPGATITVQGSPVVTTSGEDGKFTIANAGDGSKVVIVRHIGYKRAVVTVPATSNEVNVSLEKDVLELEQVVVTGAATSVSSANAAQAITTVNADNLNKAPTPTIENDLQGKIPGALITTNSGAPGGGAQVQLRGTTSINANASPLYVVDGVLVNNSAISVGLNSITNAGGGISGSQDQMVNRIADLNPDEIESIEVLKGASAGAIYGSKAAAGVIVIKTKRGQQGRTQLNVAERVGQFSISHKLGHRCFGSEQEAMDWVGVSDAADLPSPWSPVCHDFEQEYYSGNSPSYETDLSARGGTSTGMSYYVGGVAKRDNAIAKNSYYQKQQLSANVGQLIGTRWNLQVNNQFIHSLTDRGISGNDNSPIVSPGDVFSGTPSWYDLAAGERNPWLTEGTNPFQDASKVKAPEDVFRYIGAVNTTVNAYSSSRQSLDFSLIGGVDVYQDKGRVISPADVYFEPADGLPGTVVLSNANSTNANVNFSGVHKFMFDRWGTATTSFGVRKEQRSIDQMLNQARNVPAGAENIGLGAQQSVSENMNLIKDFGTYIQEEFFTLNDRLLLTAAENFERSSVNGDENKMYTYPKFSASYRSPWLPKWTTDLKVRAAYGRAGNQPPYGYKFTSLAVGVNGGLLGARPSTIAGNPDIKPETSNETEGGFDAQFLNGRMAFSATYFNKKVTDLILSASVAPTTGFTTKYVNGGTLVNKGTELSLDATPIDGKVQWVSHTTFYQVRGKVTELSVPAFTPGVGSFGTRFGSPWVEQGRSPTVIRFNNGCSQLSSTGSCPAANRLLAYVESAPDYTMGFANTINYGNISLYGLVDWRKGGYAADLTQDYYEGTGLAPDTAKTTRDLKLFAADSGIFVQPAGFVKLREVTLSYRLPQAITSHFFATGKDVRLELSGRNLLTSTKYGGYDPEVSNFSNQNLGRFQDVTPYPPSRSYFLSIVANF